jgi:hypothetical protein
MCAKGLQLLKFRVIYSHGPCETWHVKVPWMRWDVEGGGGGGGGVGGGGGGAGAGTAGRAPTGDFTMAFSHGHPLV